MAYDPLKKDEEVANNNVLNLDKFPGLNKIITPEESLDENLYTDPIPTTPLPGEDESIQIAQGPGFLSKYSTRTTTQKYLPQETRSFNKLQKQLAETEKKRQEEPSLPKVDKYADIKAIKPIAPASVEPGSIQERKAFIIKSMDDMGMTNPYERAAFMSQLSHESQGFSKLEEQGDDNRWKRYQNKKSLGNKLPGDGERYKGRGFIQLTGRYNYKKYGDKLGIDLENNPELAADPAVAVKIAHLYWKDHNISDLAKKQKFTEVTRKINGGLNGLNDRKARYKEYLKDPEIANPTKLVEYDTRNIFNKIKAVK